MEGGVDFAILLSWHPAVVAQGEGNALRRAGNAGSVDIVAVRLDKVLSLAGRRVVFNDFSLNFDYRDLAGYKLF